MQNYKKIFLVSGARTQSFPLAVSVALSLENKITKEDFK